MLFILGFISGVVLTLLSCWGLFWLVAHPGCLSEDYDSPTGYYKEVE